MTIFFSPLLIWLGWLMFFYDKIEMIWLLSISAFVILLSARILSKRRFFSFKLLWINLLLVYGAQLLFLLLLISVNIRNALAFLLTLSWALIWYLIDRYFSNIKNVESSTYLAINKFFYYLGFWFLASSLYSLVIFIHFSLLWAILILLAAGFLWSWDIIRYREDVSWLYAFFAMFLWGQVAVFVYFLPISFYVAGTIATLWYFFIMDTNINAIKSFRLYLSLFLLIILLLLVSSVI